jgi:hypothetical protein
VVLSTKLAALILAGLLTASVAVPAASNSFDMDELSGNAEEGLFSVVGLEGLEESLEDLFGKSVGEQLSERLEVLFGEREEGGDYSSVLDSILDGLLSEREEASILDEEDRGNGGYNGLEQESESGDIGQSFEVTGSGDNSNQNAPVQGVANTGNAQNAISVSQSDSEGDDFAFEDVGATVEVSPTLESTSDQRVDQNASATG